MRKAIIFTLIILTGFSAVCFSADAGLYLNKNALENSRRAVVKNHIASVVLSLQALAVKIKSLDAFGRNTLKQGVLVLECGNSGVEYLSSHFNRPDLDWKVKYWIIDILGYIKSTESQKVLRRIYNNKSIRLEIRKKAKESLWQ